MVANSDSENEMEISTMESEGEGSVSSRENPNYENSDNEQDTEDSLDLDLGECEIRRAELIKDVHSLEGQFNVLREQLYRERMHQVNIEIADLKAGTSPKYIAQLKELDEEKKNRLEVAGILLELRYQTINRQYDADNQAAAQGFENDKVLAHSEYHYELMETIKQLEEDKRNSEIAWGEGGKWDSKKSKPHTRAKKAVTVSGPFIVYMLTPEQIIEDWTEIRKASQGT